MPAIGEIVRVYRELAEIYESKGEPQFRDRFYLLAADAAFTAGRAQEAERLRQLLLKYNPHHMMKPFEGFAQALKCKDVKDYLAALRRSHPYERAEYLLESLLQAAGEESPSRIASASLERPSDIYRIQEAAPAKAVAKPPPQPSISPAPPTGMPRSPTPAKEDEIVRPAPQAFDLFAASTPTYLAAGTAEAEDGGAEIWAGRSLIIALCIIVCLGAVLLACNTLLAPLLAR